MKSDEATRRRPTVGFLSHVQKDLALAAREAGCDRVIARSAFTKDLPQILAGRTPHSTRPALAEGGGWERLGSERLMETPTSPSAPTGSASPTAPIKDPYYVIDAPTPP